MVMVMHGRRQSPPTLCVLLVLSRSLSAKCRPSVRHGALRIPSSALARVRDPCGSLTPTRLPL
eukprot:scaffold180734_cov35-Tisochrysis_lutea.AAC.1